jgi:hypothetical protein
LLFENNENGGDYMDNAEREFLARFIYESDAIEEIRDDIGLLKRQIAEDKKDGYVGAMLLLESLAKEGTDRSVDKELVCRVQGLITAEQHLKPGGPKLPEKLVGEYREVNVAVGGKLCCQPVMVPRVMIDWKRDVNVWQGNVRDFDLRANIQNVADLHFRFETIHPFADGNGRTGRALVWYMLKYAGIRPFIFTNRDKHVTYYRCFDNPEIMRRYFLTKTGLGV